MVDSGGTDVEMDAEPINSAPVNGHGAVSNARNANGLNGVVGGANTEWGQSSGNAWGANPSSGAAWGASADAGAWGTSAGSGWNL